MLRLRYRRQIQSNNNIFDTEYRYSSTNELSKQHASYGQHMEPAEDVTIPTINMQC